MLLLGLDIGTSSIKASVVDSNNLHCIASAQYPETEAEIIAVESGWAEQSPEKWWEHAQLAILKLHAQKKYNPDAIAAIGIAYQMHGLVVVDKQQQVLRNSIIWCDSRAVEIGDKAFATVGREKCLRHLLNSPGNFTASKLAWVKENEPDLYSRIYKIMLPGDFISMKLTGEITTSISALSEGVFWDFQENGLSKDVFAYFGISPSFIPEIKEVFAEHGKVTATVASALSLREGIPVTYKAGDQPNNALSLNVLEPGEVAATAGTSGVIYGISDQLTYDNESRINSFAHVNHRASSPSERVGGEVRVGVLLCINGTGILNRWVKNITGNKYSYTQINQLAGEVAPGSDGLTVLPFGNGAERMLNNKNIGAHISDVDVNKHTESHIFRAAQEGIAFAFRYGLDIMKENGMHPKVIRAGKANMFLSNVFTGSFVNTLNIPVELYNCDGSVGAATGAGIGSGIFSSAKEAFQNFKPVEIVAPGNINHEEHYQNWLRHLNRVLNRF